MALLILDRRPTAGLNTRQSKNKHTSNPAGLPPEVENKQSPAAEHRTLTG